MLIDKNVAANMTLEEAGDYILNMVEKFINVNTFCITSINETNSYFVSVFNRSDQIASSGVTISVYEAY
ncbi:hypothetical protein IM538_09460 [Cytobacillus suaedae]|nr:hypothetical protein IM538_09460 [Cytobacillus suaedae]